MGVDIATQCPLHGYCTIVHNVDTQRLESVQPKATGVLDELIDARRIKPRNAPRCRGLRRTRSLTPSCRRISSSK
jgi:hypothetical protein